MDKPGLIAEIGLVAYPDAQLSALHGLTDLFRIANWQNAALGGRDARAIRITHWRAADDDHVDCVYDTHPGQPNAPRFLIAPPSLVMPVDMARTDAFTVWMRDLHEHGATLCSVCAGAFVLAETGLLAGRQVTTHWAFAEALAARFPEIQVAAEHMVIDGGDVITAGGILAWTDLGLRLVEHLMGASVMLATARFLLVDPPGREQRSYALFVPRFDHGDGAVLKAQHWLHAHLAEETAVPDLGRLAGLEPRTFLRRFQKATGLKPVEYRQQMRIAKAREGLELTRRSIDEIGWRVGYSDPAAFRRIFHRVTGLAPGDYRRRFGVAAQGADIMADTHDKLPV
ncbi:AraC family transcriptional regulator [Neoasaia chiangmaiensis NBRC 101099]|uniref:AraC family transcriptional regulator n=1 Tax=Neoasaia chiangmaiensis TaxID=320497 RepID=A0A1U9KQL5_9PROT|nr:GlxA family transcriptional regulator [Neoasaia chiangmaiensis]AQS88151.1 AraC family transcriptional regulator [Neoasaia chiangmaiensis]GBR39994.1 AraC family transcriptional regulator [Neoasaia chiangmaiensis NBRC 101099]GEN14835.1 transcriptional regulator [Neoasaia chiangmaiensis]